MYIYIIAENNSNKVHMKHIITEEPLTRREQQILQSALNEISQKYADNGMVDQEFVIPAEAADLFEKLTKKKLQFVDVAGVFEY